MAADGLNKVLLLGNLGADPELRFTQGGQPVLNFRMAMTESYLDKDKVRQERVEWSNVVVWGKRGEALAQILHKGSKLFVEGRLATSSYDDRDGVKRYKTEVVATNIVLAGGKPGDAGEARPANGAPRGGQQAPSSAAKPARATAPAVADPEVSYGGGTDDEIPF